MTLTLNNLLSLVFLTIKAPQEGASTILSLGLSRQILVHSLALLVVLSVLLGQVTVFALGVSSADGEVPGQFVLSPIMSVMFYGMLAIILVMAIHVIGRGLGGTGSFEEGLALVTWLHFILLCLQVVQTLAFLTFPVSVGLLIWIASALLSFWLIINFIAVIHGFKSLGLVCVGVIISAIGIAFAMTLFLAMLGLSIPRSL